MTENKIAFKQTRIQSVDLLRGAIMIIMAIDHVRVYSGMPAGGLTAGIFFTRWITHYCAPGFAFLAGTSAFLYSQKSSDKSEVVRFLVSRGLLLVVLEMTVIRFFWMFNLDFAFFNMTGVIWMLGWCMVIFGAFVNLKPIAIGVLGVLIIFGQQAFYYVPAIFPASIQESVASIWGFFYPAFGSKPGVSISPGLPALPSTFGINIFYVIIPWIGIMMVGYSFGTLLHREANALRKICLRIGISSIVIFAVVATVIILFFKNDPGNIPFVYALLGQQKYPPSQLFVLMTIGPLILLVPWAEKAKGKMVDAIKTIGKVPLFYYLLHILLIHISALVVNLIFFGSIRQELYTTAPFVAVPEPERWGLPLLYLVWLIDLPILYLACRWYAKFKSSRPNNVWLKYL